MKYIAKNPKFYISLKTDVENYFRENGISKSGNWVLYAKAFILLTLFVFLFYIPYAENMSLFKHWLYGGVLLGIVVSCIGFNIGHDAVHRSFSNKRGLNTVLSYAFELVGVSSYFWDKKHNVAHHTYTNVEGMDDDTDTGGLFRFSPDQEWNWWHRIQVFYAILFYSLLYVQWIFLKDFQKWVQKKVGNTNIPKMNSTQIISIIVSKLVHIIIFWVIPIFYFGFIETFIVTGSMYITCGVTITIVFQLAHIQTKSHFPVPNETTGNIENDWAIEQIRTTADFATWNPVVTHFTGGLNHQVEHHLFPNISHVHYPAIRKIVKKKCQEFDIQYNEYHTTIGAIIDHMKYLWIMGKKPKIV